MKIVGDYTFLHEIGAGSFATVWKAQNRRTGEIVAIKQIIPSKHPQQQLKFFAKEKQIMKSICHPNIVKLLEVIGDESFFEGIATTKYIVMEYCEGGDLHHYMCSREKVDLEVTRAIMLQLAQALLELRKRNLIHRDLKPHNLLLKNRVDANEDGSGIVIKLTDFGLSTSLQPRGMAETFCGTFLYMAPEVISKHKYDAKADLWSVGVMLYQMVTGRTPFNATKPNDFMIELPELTKIEFREEDSWDPDCRSLCEGLLRKNPVQRITFEEFFNHRFLIRKEASEKQDQAQHHNDGSLQHRDDEYVHQGKDGDIQDQGNQYDGADEFHVKRQAEQKIHVQDLEVGVEEENCDSMKNLQNIVPVRVRMTNFVEPIKFQMPLAMIPERHRHHHRNIMMDSIDEKVEKEYVIVNKERSHSPIASPIASSSRKKQLCPVPRSPHSIRKIHQPQQEQQEQEQQQEKQQEQQQEQQQQLVHQHQEQFQNQQPLPDQTHEDDPERRERSETLRVCARLLQEVARFKLQENRKLDAFSLHLTALRTLKQAMSISSTSQVIEDLSSAVDKAIAVSETLNEEEIRQPLPDAADVIYSAALALGKLAAVDDLVERYCRASVQYAKASTLLFFLLTEDSPMHLCPLDVARLRHYLDAITDRHKHCKKMREDRLYDNIDECK